eukprot:15346469-Ditylum_brightwellii.AAC.1
MSVGGAGTGGPGSGAGTQLGGKFVGFLLPRLALGTRANWHKHNKTDKKLRDMQTCQSLSLVFMPLRVDP